MFGRTKFFKFCFSLELQQNILTAGVSLQTFGMPRIELGLQDPQPCVLPLYDIPGRAAENCTRSTSSRRMCTTGILRPESAQGIAKQFLVRPIGIEPMTFPM